MARFPFHNIPRSSSVGLIDAEADLGIERGSDTGNDNAERLTNALADKNHRHEIVFGGGDTNNDNTDPYIFTKTIVFPGHGGLRIRGLGPSRVSDAHPDRSVQWMMSPSTNVVFDAGTTNDASSDGTDAVITITGDHVVTDDDKERWLDIPSNVDNYVAGSYMINDTNSSANTWTLDRNPTNGSPASGLQATAYDTLVKNNGSGTVHDGVSFVKADGVQSGTKSGIAYHMSTRTTGNINSGKHTWRNCSWGGFRVGVLAGKDMTKAYEEENDYDGEGALYADNTTFHDVRVLHCDTWLYVRNEQAVGFQVEKYASQNTDTAFYFERGGFFEANTIEMANGSPTVLQIGQPDGTSGIFILRNVRFDISNVTSPRIVKIDSGLNRVPRVIVDGALIPRQITDFSAQALFEWRGGGRLTIRNAHGLPGDCLHIPSISTWKPHIVFEDCTFRSGDVSVSDDVIRTGTVSGISVTYRNCTADQDSDDLDLDGTFLTP